MINRGAYAANDALYTKSRYKNPILHEELAHDEHVRNAFRRYQLGGYEYPFTELRHHRFAIPALNLTNVLHNDNYVINDQIYNFYVQDVIPSLNLTGDDQLYELTVTADLTLLRALSRRIHYGKIVAESKFLGPQSAQYIALIKNQDVAGITALLTDPTQEATVIARATAKAIYYGQTLNYVNGVLVPSGINKIPPEAVTNLYQNYVIPLTKDIEVYYLLHRLDN